MGEVLKLEVGREYEKFRTRQDGYRMEWSDNGLTLYVLLNGITELEMEQFKTEKSFEIRPFEVENILFFCVKFGDMEWGDCSFTRAAHKSSLDVPEISEGTGLSLTIVVADTSNGEVKSLRIIGLGTKISKVFKNFCEKEFEYSFEDTMRMIDMIYMRYSTRDLVRMSDSINRFKL